MNKDRGMLNIKRINDHHSIDGWLVQIVRSYNGKPYTVIAKLFNDKDYYNRAEALIAAKKYRDSVLHKYPPYCFSTFGKYFTRTQAEKNFQRFLQGKLNNK